MTDHYSSLDKLYQKLVNTDYEFNDKDRDLIVNYYDEMIPIGVLKGRTGTVEEWFINNHPDPYVRETGQ